jgi:hypothetical protein
MPNALPILLAGGAALLLMGGKKGKKSVPDSGKDLPDVTGDEPEGTAEPETKSDSEPEPMPGPGLPEPAEPKRPLGPSGVGSCANDIYRRDAVYIDSAVAGRLSQGALTAYSDAGYYFYIRKDAQEKIFDAALPTFASMAAKQSAPTLRSVVLREILNGFVNNHCDWDVPTNKFDAPMRLVWDDGIRLLTMAQMMANHTDPHPDNLFKTGKRYTMPRLPLGLPDEPMVSPKMNRRIMILATDKSLQNAEHLIGRVTKLTGPNGEPNKFEIRIVDTFQGEDVRPLRSDKHGFKDLSNAYFSKTTPTGVYRLYAEGVV